MMNGSSNAHGMDDVTVGTEMTEMQRAEAGDSVGASLPHPDEIRTTVNPHSKKCCSGKNPWCLVVASLTLLAVIILSVALGVTLSDRDESHGRNSSPEDIQEYVVRSLKISTDDQFVATDSPQRLAAEWLAFQDELNLKVPSPTADLDNNDEAYEFLVRYVMVVLYYSTDGGNWRFRFNFLTEERTCNWNGVLLSTSGGFISFGLLCNQQRKAFAIYLDDINLKGELPNELEALTSLVAIDFNYNEELSGPFPNAVCAMSGLQFLSVGYTRLTGNLPSCIGDLAELRLLLVSNTDMSGPLPNMDGMVKLERLFLDDNDFVGDITSHFDNMRELRFLFLEDNGFTGMIDSNFLASMQNLTQVDISDNKIGGEIPVHLMELDRFQLLDLHGNQLVGPMPDSFPASEAMLFLALHDNELEGTIDPSITNLSRLFHLDLSNNSISGEITPELGLMTNLTYLYLAQNDFLPGMLPATFSQLRNLEEFSVKSTQRNGTLPEYIGEWSDLLLLDLDDNDFDGNIPSSYGNLSKLQFLLLNDNSLEGQVPNSFGNLINLRAGFLEGNLLEGDLAHMCQLANLNELSGDLDGDELLVADCDGGNIQCDCCVCCNPSDPNDADRKCNDHELITNLDPQWESIYTRVEFNFGNETRFTDRAFLP